MGYAACGVNDFALTEDDVWEVLSKFNDGLETPLADDELWDVLHRCARISAVSPR